MTTEIARVSWWYTYVSTISSSFIFTFIQIGIAFWLSAQMTIFVLIFGLALIFFSRKFIKKSSDLVSKYVELSKAYLAGITDQFNGIKEIKSNTFREISY